MAHFISILIALGTYLMYVCSFHNALPKHHSVLKKTLISHLVLAVLVFLLFFVAK